MEQTAFPTETGALIAGILTCVFSVVIPILFIISLILAIVRKSKAWTIVAVLSALLGAGVLLVGAMQGFKLFQQAAKEAAIDKTVKSSDGLFEVTVPGHWSPQNLELEEASVRHGNLFREEYFVVLSEPKTDFDEGFSLREFAELAAETSSDNLDDAKASPIAPVTGSALPAVRCEITGSTEGIQLVYLNTYLESPEHFIQVIAWTLPSKRAAAMPHFEKAANSLRVATSAEAP